MAESKNEDGAGTRSLLQGYEVLGYIVPGGSALFLAALWELWASAKVPGVFDTPILSAASSVEALLPGSGDLSFIDRASFLACLVALAYVVGHIVASISSLAIDRILVYRGYGYPFVSLLGLDSCRPDTRDQASAAFYRAVFFWVNVHLLMVYAGAVLHAISMSWSQVTGWVLGAWLLLKVFAMPLLAPRETEEEDGQLRKAAGFINRSLVGKPSALAYDTIAKILGRFLHSQDPLPLALRQRFESAMRTVYPGVELKDLDTENYWLPYIWIAENAPSAARSIGAWLAQYAFARNLSTAFYLVFVYCLAWSLWWHPHATAGSGLALYPLGLFVASLIMLIRYYYLYHCYYSRHVFRAFAYLAPAPGAGAPSAPPEASC